MRAKCPTCEREVQWDPANPFRPFCSERCKLIDLGAWLAEEHRVAGEEAPADDEDDAAPRGQT
ncbi:MAG TPA: DNA gyrase inhibitor YacG [Steroidobacteraceae bacterium]|nr:DNA gyrase inhibitor YacG [Steroidobacteraceae bacterium]